jgi:hypothetical protein
VAEGVLANTLAQVAIMRPDPRSNAMRDLFAKLLELDDVNSHIDGLMSGLATRYDLGSERDLVGRLISDRPVVDADLQSTLFATMTHGDGVILDTSADGRVAELAARFTHVRCCKAASGPTMLIRPDGCIAWAGDADETGGLEDALERWFARGARA